MRSHKKRSRALTVESKNVALALAVAMTLPIHEASTTLSAATKLLLPQHTCRDARGVRPLRWQ